MGSESLATVSSMNCMRRRQERPQGLTEGLLQGCQQSRRKVPGAAESQSCSHERVEASLNSQLKTQKAHALTEGRLQAE